MDVDARAWDEERRALLGKRISELGLSIRGSRVERLVAQLYRIYLNDGGEPIGGPLEELEFDEV